MLEPPPPPFDRAPPLGQSEHIGFLLTSDHLPAPSQFPLRPTQTYSSVSQGKDSGLNLSTHHRNHCTFKPWDDPMKHVTSVMNSRCLFIDLRSLNEFIELKINWSHTWGVGVCVCYVCICIPHSCPAVCWQARSWVWRHCWGCPTPVCVPGSPIPPPCHPGLGRAPALCPAPGCPSLLYRHTAKSTIQHTESTTYLNMYCIAMRYKVKRL